MQTDSFFYKLFKQLPATLFELLHLPAERAQPYRFDSVELKKSLRIDGLFLPDSSSLPLYFVEVQFQPVAKFYANLFAKAFSYLDENDPAQDWHAVAIFENRKTEPKQLVAYTELLHPNRTTRIYLDEYPMPSDPPFGLAILQLASAPEVQVKDLASRLLEKAKEPVRDRVVGDKVIELVEELLMRRFTNLTREEIRAMFPLADIRDTRAWQEAHQEGRKEGREVRDKEMVNKFLAKGMSPKDIADLMEISLSEVQRLAESPER